MKKSILKINTEIKKLQLQKLNIQKNCKHLNHTEKHGGDTGNYDPSQDCYWTNFECLDCGKMWTVTKKA